MKAEDLPTYLVEPRSHHWVVRRAGEEAVVFEGDFRPAWDHAMALARRVAHARVRALNERGQPVAEEHA